jgi:hypothetical protein
LDSVAHPLGGANTTFSLWNHPEIRREIVPEEPEKRKGAMLEVHDIKVEGRRLSC